VLTVFLNPVYIQNTTGCPTLRRNKWLLHHDNAPCYTSLAAHHFLAKNGIPTLTRPPYSPALALCVTSGPL